MMAFRIFLALVLLTVVGYTTVVIQNHGMGLFPIFFGDIAKFGWPGQFNVDFTCMLGFSGLWMAFRHRFSAVGIALGLLAFVGGTPLLCTYLLVESFRVKGDVAALLLGENRAKVVGTL